MEDIEQRLQTLPSRRQRQFQFIAKNEIDECFGGCTQIEDQVYFQNATNTIIQETKERIIKFMLSEEKEKIVKRKHGSKGKKHREKGPGYIKNIEKKLQENRINFPLLFKEFLNTTLREKHSEKGIGYIGLCPFHKENTPSFSISPSGTMKCFGCGEASLPEHFLAKYFKVKYSKGLGMLEKYILTPQETQAWNERSEIVKKSKSKTLEQKQKEEFVSCLSNDSGYLSKKEFAIAFTKRKEEKELRDQKISENMHSQNGQETHSNFPQTDDLPF